MTRALLVAMLLLAAAAALPPPQVSSSGLPPQLPAPTNKQDTDCNARARGFWDAPAWFWENFYKECPPEQVGTLDGEPVYATRGDLRPTLVRGGVPPLPPDSPITSAEAVVAVTIRKTGRVADVTLVRSSGDKKLDDDAVQLVKKWRFKPAKRNGQGVAVRENIIVPFEKPST